MFLPENVDKIEFRREKVGGREEEMNSLLASEKHY